MVGKPFQSQTGEQRDLAFQGFQIRSVRLTFRGILN